MSDSTGKPDDPQRPAGPPAPTGWSAQQPPPQAPPPGWGAPPPPPPGAPPVGWAPPPPAPQPGVVPLRPLGVSDVLEGAWRVFRQHWQLLLSASGVLALVTALAAVPYTVRLIDAMRPLLELDYEHATEATVQRALDQALAGWGWLALWAVAAGLVSLLATTTLAALVALVTGDAALGRGASWPTVWPRLRSRLGPALGTGLLVVAAALAVLAVVGLLVALLVAGLGAVGVALSVLAVLGLVPLWVYVIVHWVFAVPASALERAAPVTALRRAWRLVTGQWWPTFGLLVLLGLIYSALSTVVSTPLSMVAQAGNPAVTLDSTIDADAFLGLMLVSLLATAVTNALVYPFVSAAITLKYLDLRFRKEGLAEQLAASEDDVRS